MTKKWFLALALLVITLGIVSVEVHYVGRVNRQKEIKFAQAVVMVLEKKIPGARWSYAHASNGILKIFAKFEVSEDSSAVEKKIVLAEKEIKEKYKIRKIEYVDESNAAAWTMKKGEKPTKSSYKSRTAVFSLEYRN